MGPQNPVFLGPHECLRAGWQGKDTFPSGEAGPGALIQPSLTSHSYKLCPGRLPALLLPGTQRGRWQGQASDQDGAGPCSSHLRAQGSRLDLGNMVENHREGQSRGLMLAQSGFASRL